MAKNKKNNDPTVTANNVNVNTTAPKGDKRILIIVIALATALLLVGAGFLIDHLLEVDEPQNVADTGETLDGEYSLSMSAGAFATSASYSFDGRKVTEKYYDTSTREIVTKEYTYVIAIVNGEKVIKLTPADGSGTTTSHGFYTGTFNGKPFISINEEKYFKVEEAE